MLAEQLRIVIPRVTCGTVGVRPDGADLVSAALRQRSSEGLNIIPTKSGSKKKGRLKELYQCVEFTTTAIFERELSGCQ